MVLLMVGALVSVLKGSRELYAGQGACLWELTLQQPWGETGAFPFLVTLLSHHKAAHALTQALSLIFSPRELHLWVWAPVSSYT